MTERIYVLKSEKWEDLYLWTINIKILKIKSFYDNFFSCFWYVNFPLFETGREKEKSELSEYVFKLNISNNSIKTNSNNGIKIKKIVDFQNKMKERKLSILSNLLGLSFKESNSLRKRTEHLYLEILLNYFKFIIRYGFSLILNNIQIKINRDIHNEYNNNKIDLLFIKNTFLMGKEETDIRNYLRQITSNNGILKMRIEEEKKNECINSDKENKYISEKYNNYILKYFPIKTFGEAISYKIRDLKKVANYNRIINSKNFDEIEFIEDQEESLKKEDNIRFGDYTDITSPYPLNKYNSNNNYFINDLENGEKRRKRSIVLQNKGDNISIKHQDKDELLNESHKNSRKNLSTFLKNTNNYERKNKMEDFSDTKKDYNNSFKTENKNMLEGYFTNINKENELKSIKEETDYFKSKINRNKNSFSSISSSLSSSDSKVNQIKKIGKDTNNNAEKLL